MNINFIDDIEKLKCVCGRYVDRSAHLKQSKNKFQLWHVFCGQVDI